MSDDRYCSNCRTPLRRGADTCEKCGVYAGELFDGKVRAAPGTAMRRIRGLLFAIVVIAILWFAIRFFERDSGRKLLPQISDLPDVPASVRVVKDRPGGSKQPSGAAISEAEAIRLARRHLTQGDSSLKDECLAMTSQGYAAGVYRLTAVDSCKGIRLGRFQVNGTTKDVGPLR